MINTDISTLADPFRAKAQQLVDTIEREGLPFEISETRRAFSRTAALFMQGREYDSSGVIQRVGPIVSNARAGESPHNWGLALDCKMTVVHPWWDGDIPAKGPFDTGYDGTTLARPAAMHAWERYGRTIKACGLDWGGLWKSIKDLPHAEMPRWQSLRPTNWKEIALREVQAGR